MDERRQIQDFLVSRRARITPQQAGLSVPQRGRRVPGLRREEVATLAGLSVDYYNRLERGNLAAASDSVLNSIADALQLDDVEREHLFHLARAGHTTSWPRPRRPTTASVAPSTQAVLDALLGVPAIVRSSTLGLLATNELARALYAPMLQNPHSPANLARFLFLDPQAREFWIDWKEVADDLVGHLQAAAGRNPHDRALTDLVGELSTRSEDFRVLWAQRDVRAQARGVKRIQHPVVGRLELRYDVMLLAAEHDLTLVAYTAEPGSTSSDNLHLLATWTATARQDEVSGSDPSVSTRKSGAQDDHTA